MSKFKTRRLTEHPPRIVGRSPADYAQELQEWLAKIWQTATGAIPPGFNNVTPNPVGTAGDPGLESTGWAAADHVHDGTHNLLNDDLHGDTTAASPLKGSIIAGTGTKWVALTAGTNDYVLTADSTQADGIKWAPASADEALALAFMGL